jgi:hypothetical protein
VPVLCGNTLVQMPLLLLLLLLRMPTQQELQMCQPSVQQQQWGCTFGQMTGPGGLTLATEAKKMSPTQAEVGRKRVSGAKQITITVPVSVVSSYTNSVVL